MDNVEKPIEPVGANGEMYMPDGEAGEAMEEAIALPKTATELRAFIRAVTADLTPDIRAMIDQRIDEKIGLALTQYPTRAEVIDRIDDNSVPITKQLGQLEAALRQDVKAREQETLVRADQAKRLADTITALNNLSTRFETHEQNRALERRETVERLEKEDARLEGGLTALATTVHQLKVTIHGDATVRDDQPSLFGELNLLRADIRDVKANQQIRLSDDQEIRDFIKRAQAREARWEAAKDYVKSFVTSKKGAGAIGLAGTAIAAVIEFAKALTGS